MSLFDLSDYDTAPNLDEWCADDWETPDEVARFMASLVSPADCAIIEPAAGMGQIAQYLPRYAACVELNPMRHMIGKSAAKDGQLWLCDDFLRICNKMNQTVDLVIGNPPFSLGMEFLAASFKVLADNGRILFLLPSQYFQAQERAGLLKELRKAEFFSSDIQVVDPYGKLAK